ncbi:hypothetical protein KEM56_001387 [Ascosphaera pollenicola]|nr:hypothetical protein KEM56_001387 [Ascosphaera pollenicola]
MARLASCERILKQLQDDLAVISPELVSTHETLVSILRSTSAANTRSKFNAKEVESFKTQLLSIQATMQDGHFVTSDGSISGGEDIVRELLFRCLGWCDTVLERHGKIDERFQDVYDELVGIRNALDKLSMTKAWSLRETDLYSYQRRLDRFDESRVNGNFVDAQGRPADTHARRLNSIDSMRVDGKFYVGDDIPEGQGSINDLLAQCYDLCYEIRADADEAAEAAEAAASSTA